MSFRLKKAFSLYFNNTSAVRYVILRSESFAAKTAFTRWDARRCKGSHVVRLLWKLSSSPHLTHALNVGSTTNSHPWCQTAPSQTEVKHHCEIKSPLLPCGFIIIAMASFLPSPRAREMMQNSLKCYSVLPFISLLPFPLWDFVVIVGSGPWGAGWQTPHFNLPALYSSFVTSI